jgi:hypothetical protein
MDTKTLVVGQDVYINWGFGRSESKVVKVVPPCIYVETMEVFNGRDNKQSGKLFLFNFYGKECGPDGNASRIPMKTMSWSVPVLMNTATAILPHSLYSI